jgi:hypothetical protein
MPWIAPSNRFGVPRSPRYFLAGTLVTADAMLAVTSVAGLLGDASARLENLGRLVGDALLPLENLGLLVVVADALARLEFALRWLDNALVPIENTGTTGGSVTINASGYLEWLTTARADMAAATESLARAIADIAAQLENLSAGSINTGGVSNLPLEFTARLIDDQGHPTAWVLSVSVGADTSSPIEISRETPRPAPSIYPISGVRVRLLRGD